MKNQTVIFSLLMCVFALGLVAQANKGDVLSADFIGTKADTVYRIVTKVSCHTVLELPAGAKIKHFVIGDQKLWKAESDGKFAFIKPIQAGIETTVSIVTRDGHLLNFTAAEASAMGEMNFHKLVKITYEDETPMIKKVAVPEPEIAQKGPSAEEIEKQIESRSTSKKIEMIRKIDYSFKVKHDRFNVVKVFQDGVFTYVDLAKTQIRPAVFLADKGDREKLEPVQFVDENGIYTVHRILAPGQEFILKHGTDYTRILRAD